MPQLIRPPLAGGPTARSSARMPLALLAAALPMLIAPAAAPVPLLLVWNASSSAPLGLYRVFPGIAPRAGEMAAAWLPPRFRALAAQRNYLPDRVPLIKRVAAARGSRICAREDTILIDGTIRARRMHLDREGRPLPRWNGCRVLRPGELFLLNDSPLSFDGRYFGPIEASRLIGRAVLLWRR